MICQNCGRLRLRCDCPRLGTTAGSQLWAEQEIRDAMTAGSPDTATQRAAAIGVTYEILAHTEARPPDWEAWDVRSTVEAVVDALIAAGLLAGHPPADTTSRTVKSRHVNAGDLLHSEERGSPCTITRVERDIPTRTVTLLCHSETMGGGWHRRGDSELVRVTRQGAESGADTTPTPLADAAETEHQ